MTTPSSPPIGATPFALRRWSVEHEVRPLFRRVFDERPEVRSILLAVAQYWADEADDAVHGHLVMSAREVPRWPHRCADDAHPGDGDLCTYCCARDFDDPRARWVSWNENGLAIRCWQAFCTEGATQEEDPNLAAVPVLVGRRHEGGVAIDFVARVSRPWLDLPTTGLPTWFLQEDASTPLEPVVVTRRPPEEAPFRAAIAAAPFDDGPRLVFADWLEQRGDPLGEFIALSLLRPRTEAASIRRRALVQEHAEAWLGELVGCVPPGSADFSRGLLTGASVCFDEQTRSLATSPQWATVEHLSFAETSPVVFSPTMSALRSVSGLRREGLATLPSTVTHVACRPDVALGLPAHVKALTLVVPFAATSVEPLRAALACPSLAHVEALALGLEPVFDEGAPPPWELVRTVFERGGPRVVSAGGWAGLQRTGWWLERSRDAWDQPRLSSARQGPFHTDELRTGLLRAFKEAAGARVRVVVSDGWRPAEGERAALAREGLDVSVAHPELNPHEPRLAAPPRPPPRALPLVVDPISRAVSVPVEAASGERPRATLARTKWVEAVLLIGVGVALAARLGCGAS